MNKLKYYWRLWACALGNKVGKSDKESDMVAIIRTLILLIYLVTNLMICAGIIKHWYD